MAHRPVILIVDNRASSQAAVDQPRNQFKCSGFKATEVDANDEAERASSVAHEFLFISQLEERVSKLQTRVNRLERHSDMGKFERRHRRKANQIAREFQCPHEDCAKYYGSETSLKNHIKLKHDGLHKP